MRLIFSLIFSLIALVCLGQGNLKDLQKAYKAKSNELYDQFLEKWLQDAGPISSLDSLDEIKKDTYLIFMDFYNPFNLQRIGTGEWGEDLYSGIEYVIIQNSIFIYTYKTDSLKYSILDNIDSLLLSKDSIMDFRPASKFDQAKTLYLIPKYEQIINQFLGSKSYPLGYGGIMNPSRAKGESAKRLEFLNRKLNIIHGHWGGYWHIETHPEVFSIDFNVDRTMAKVNYKLVYQGGEAYYEKHNGSWIFKRAKLTWIE